MLHEIEGFKRYKYDDEKDVVISYCRTHPYQMAWVKPSNGGEVRCNLQGEGWGYPASLTRTQIRQRCKTLGTSHPLTPNSTTGYVIAHQDNNGPMVFSVNPKLHTNEAEVKAECERLATKHPGRRFTYFKAIGSVTTGMTLWRKYL